MNQPPASVIETTLIVQDAPCSIKPGGQLSCGDAASLTRWFEIPGLPKTARGWRGRYDSNQLVKAEVGKSFLIPWILLPDKLRSAMKRYATSQAAQSYRAEPPTETGEPTLNVSELTDKQRSRMQARLSVVRHIEDIGLQCGESRAVRTFLDQQSAGELPKWILAAIRAGHAKHSADWDGTISSTTLYAWMAAACKGPAALATKRLSQNAPPEWAPLLMAIWGKPQKPSMASCARNWSKHYPGVPGPEKKQIERYLKTLPLEVREYGRHSRNARRAIQPFTRRITEGLWPMDVVIVDGHLFKSYVKHPVTGKPFRPEITTYMDVSTRRIVGVSLAIAESKESIWSALRDMVHTNGCGIPAIQYSDRGAYKGEEHRATMERIGTTLMFAEPYRAQSRGLIERLNRFYVEMAKEFDTYCGRDADQEHFKKALKVAKEDGKNIPSWDEAVTNLQAWRDEYNNRPHRSIGGKTPNQAWEQAVDEGWKPTLLDDDDLYDLLPCVERICRRGEIKMPWGLFYADELRHYDGKQLRAHFDYDTGSTIWIADLEGRFLCEAHRDANARPYIAENSRQLAIDKRAQGQVRRKQRDLDRIEQERRGVLPADPLMAFIQEKDSSTADDNAAFLTDQSAATKNQLSHEEQEELNRKDMGRWLDINEAIEADKTVSETDLAFYRKFEGTRVWKNYMDFLEDYTREEMRV